MEGLVSGPALPPTYKPPIASQGTSLLFCEMGITIIAHSPRGWRPILKTKEKNTLNCCESCGVLFKFRDYGEGWQNFVLNS